MNKNLGKKTPKVRKKMPKYERITQKILSTVRKIVDFLESFVNFTERLHITKSTRVEAAKLRRLLRLRFKKIW